MHHVYLSLGSNIDDRFLFLQEGMRRISHLPSTKVTKISPIYETAAWGVENQTDFYNLVVRIETKLSPDVLLAACQDIERNLMRTRVTRWGPRTLDIDILLFDELVIETENLTIPHPLMCEREFVLRPLADIAPELILDGMSVAKHLEKFDGQSTCRHVDRELSL